MKPVQILHIALSGMSPLVIVLGIVLGEDVITGLGGLCLSWCLIRTGILINRASNLWVAK